MRDRPTLASLRTRVFKHSSGGCEGGTWLARRIARPLAVYGTWLAVRLGISAHAVTIAAIAAGLAGAAGIGVGSRAGFASGVGLLWLAYLLDHVDGQVARWNRSASLSGVYLDYLMHHSQGMAVGFALGYGLANLTDQLRWAAAGFMIALGWAMLSLHNDCRYKAFFQRIKQGGSYIVDGQSEGLSREKKTQIPQKLSWVWPLQKMCEPHVVLIILTPIAFAAIFAPSIGVIAWKIFAATSTVVAPFLATARVAKAVHMGTADAEFDGWFRPADRP